MLLDQVILELSEKRLQIAGNESPSCFSHTSGSFPSTGDSIALEESSENENSGLLSDDSIDRETDCKGTQEKELNLPLESSAKLCNILESQKFDSPSGSFRLTASIPFKWEEKPGKAKNPSPEKPNYALRLPPIRQSGLYSRAVDHKSSRKMANNLSGRHNAHLQDRPSKPISQVSKVPIGLEVYKHELAKDFTNSDLESIWEEEDEEEMLELCKKTYSSQDFQDIHCRRSYDSIYPETIEEYMLGIGSFADNGSTRCPSRQRAILSRSAEFAPRRFHSPWIGFRSSELGLHDSEMKFLKMAKSPCRVSLSSCKSPVSDWTKPSLSKSPPALLANCLLSVIDMSNAVPVEDFSFSNFKLPEENDMSMSGKKELLENDGSWPSLVQKSLSGQLRSSQKYHQELMRSQSVQAASSLHPLKKVSSMVKGIVRNSQGSLYQEYKEMGTLEKIRKTQGQKPMTDEEEYTDEEEDDDDDHVSSPKKMNVTRVAQGSGCLKSSNSSCDDSVPLGLPDSNSSKDLLPLVSSDSRSSKEMMPSGRWNNCPCNTSVTPVKDDYPKSNKLQRLFMDDVETRGPMEVIEAVKCKGSCQKHSKRTNYTKIQVFSVLLRKFIINCWFPNSTRRSDNIGLCRRSGTPATNCIEEKQISAYLGSS